MTFSWFAENFVNQTVFRGQNEKSDSIDEIYDFRILKEMFFILENDVSFRMCRTFATFSTI